ncbi:hypothetical protein BC941DRAFT_446956 [Chlamydoabsidia padenii]|nr:hypothetical protein BC941DRAFT_446956 [Chlamydoabsidia padenii]
MIRLSPPTEDNQSLLHTSTTTTNSGTSAKQQSSSLLLQRRLAPKLGNHTPQLTINTPAYKDHPLHMIQSAPLRKSISKHQINKRLQAAAVAACTATGLHPPSSHLHQPIIASHHHPKQHFQHRRLRPSLSPPTNNSDNNNNKKQQFLQPFEYLHNSLEHVRAQKIRLDDTIRQSSTWLVADEMDGWMTNYTNQLQHCMDRILSLERKTTVDQQQKAAESGDELMVLMRRLEQLEEKANST